MIHPIFAGGRQPLDIRFNAAVLHMASRLFPCGFDVTMDEAEAPDTLEKLTDHVNRTGRMLVWGGASDRTIYCDEEVNWASRAWHDWCHYSAQLPFTPEGEAAVCALQQEQLRTVFGNNERTQQWCRILDAEVNGQISYHNQHGEFPIDQHRFVTLALSGLPYMEAAA